MNFDGYCILHTHAGWIVIVAERITVRFFDKRRHDHKVILKWLMKGRREINVWSVRIGCNLFGAFADYS